MKRKSLFFPLLLISVGIVLFLTNIGIIPGTAWGILVTYWPVILILGGLDGLYQREGWVGSLVLVGFGTVLTLGNLGYLEQNAWQLLLRLWPIFLIGIGLDLTFGQGHSAWSVIGRVFLAFLLVGGIFWLGVAAPRDTPFSLTPVNQALDGASSSSLQFSLAAGEFDLQGGAGANSLLSGKVSLPGSDPFAPQYTAPQSGYSSYSLEVPGVAVGAVNRGQAILDLKVTSKIPLDIHAKLGAGTLKLDLKDTQTRSVQADLGVGRSEIDLPARVSVEGNINTAVGEIVLGVPACAGVKIQVDRGLTDLQVPAGYTQAGGLVSYPAPAGCSGNQINLNVGLAMGSLRIVRLP